MQRTFLIRLLPNSNTPSLFGLRVTPWRREISRYKLPRFLNPSIPSLTRSDLLAKFSLKNITTAWAGTRASTLYRRYTHPITEIDLKEPDVIRQRLCHISP